MSLSCSSISENPDAELAFCARSRSRTRGRRSLIQRLRRIAHRTRGLLALSRVREIARRLSTFCCASLTTLRTRREQR
jgi:hypothetical protein